MPLLPTREPIPSTATSPEELLARLRILFSRKHFMELFDTIEQGMERFPETAIATLVFAHAVYQNLPDQSRYGLYQSRIFDFPIKEGDKVLDLGSGHDPFPLATHLADISTTDHSIGRAGAAFRHISGKPVYECSVEKTPFADKEFDFVYCSHVLEHAEHPDIACRELMRIAKRGYIETPTRGKDIFLNSARISNHFSYVELFQDVLTFIPYKAWEREGLGYSILQNMASQPQTDREKAFSTLIYLRPRQVNTMLMWEDSFEYKIVCK